MSTVFGASRTAGAALNTRRVIVALSVSTFVEWAGAGAVLPLFPLYLRKHGAPVALVGAAMAAFFFAAVFVQYPIGRLSDRLGRRPIQLGGLLTYSAASAAFALIGTPIAALFVRSLQGIGAGVVDVANNATVGEVVPPSQQGRAFGAVFGSRTVGLSIGPLFGGLAGIAHMRWLFIGSAVASLVACLPILLVVPKGRFTASRRKPRLGWCCGGTAASSVSPSGMAPRASSSASTRSAGACCCTCGAPRPGRSGSRGPCSPSPSRPCRSRAAGSSITSIAATWRRERHWCRPASPPPIRFSILSGC